MFVGVVLLAGAGLLAWGLMSEAFNPAQRTPSEPTPTNSKPAKAQPISTRIEIVGAKDFDPTNGGGNGEEHPEDVALTFDGKSGTEWTTMSYRGDPRLGLLKKGVGIYFDLGKVTEIGQVRLDLVGNGTDLELRAAPEDAAEPPADAAGWQAIAGASATGAGEQVTLKPDEPIRTRWVLVWMTKLPPEDGEFRGGVREIVVRR